jgi:hypothetical protein
MSQPTMTVCACSDPWCRVNGCRIANAQRYGAQINYGPAYVVPNLHAECAKREEQLVAEVERLRGERAAVVAWLREHGSGAWLEHGGLSLVCLDEIADKFERGEHRREEGA